MRDPCKPFVSLRDNVQTAVLEGNKQLCFRATARSLTARDEEKINVETYYRYIYLLQHSCIFLGGISQQPLWETKQSFGWVPGTALPFFVFLQIWLSQRPRRTRELRISM